MKYDETYLLSLIQKVKWIWAKTYISVPHEYIVRNRCGLKDEEFDYFVLSQWEFGIHEQWHKYNFPYLYVGGYKYWTMGESIDKTIIINRQKVFSEFDGLDSLNEEHSPSLIEETFKLFRTSFPQRSLYECGCGCGSSIKYLNITPENYIGVDPSQKAINAFKINHPEFSNRIFKKSFEESVNYWSKGDSVILATFGAASYFMHQYLRILSQCGKDYFLMFYGYRFCPNSLKEMHHFEYSDYFLKSLLLKTDDIHPPKTGISVHFSDFLS